MCRHLRSWIMRQRERKRAQREQEWKQSVAQERQWWLEALRNKTLDEEKRVEAVWELCNDLDSEVEQLMLSIALDNTTSTDLAEACGEGLSSCWEFIDTLDIDVLRQMHPVALKAFANNVEGDDPCRDMLVNDVLRERNIHRSKVKLLNVDLLQYPVLLFRDNVFEVKATTRALSTWPTSLLNVALPNSPVLIDASGTAFTISHISRNGQTEWRWIGVFPMRFVPVDIYVQQVPSPLSVEDVRRHLYAATIPTK